MKRVLTKYMNLVLALATVTSVVSCTQESYDDQIEVTTDMLDASFTVEQVSANHYLLSSSNNYVIYNYWDFADGGGYVKGENPVELFLPDAGTFTIKHKVTGAGGITSDEAATSITVDTSDPVSGNLIKGGTFASSADIAQWTIGGAGSNGGTWTFADNKATLTAGGWAGNGIYQAVSVTAGMSYKINMTASSTSGCSETWFEVYCGYSVPGSSDYGEGKLYEINTWAGTGTAAFSGKIGTVGSATSTPAGVFTATATGTVYLVIRGGGNDMRSGISVTNVEFRGISE